MSGVFVKSFSGDHALSYIDDLARLRIEVFKDFPYLYEGSYEEEATYLHHFLHGKDHILVIAFDGKQVVGASTGMPLAEADPDIQKPWLNQNIPIDQIFYYGESVLRTPYRKQGIGVQFYDHREKWAITLNRFELLTFCAVVRPKDHPETPKNYFPLDQYWTNRGFKITQNLICEMTWKDVDQLSPSIHQLVFWYKFVNPAKESKI